MVNIYKVKQMTKKELLKFDPPFRMIVDLYEDDEEIPVEIIKALYYVPKPKPYVMLMSAEGLELFNRMCKKYYDSNL